MSESSSIASIVEEHTGHDFDSNLLVSDKGRIKSCERANFKAEIEGQIRKKRMFNFMKVFKSTISSRVSSSPIVNLDDKSLNWQWSLNTDKEKIKNKKRKLKCKPKKDKKAKKLNMNHKTKSKFAPSYKTKNFEDEEISSSDDDLKINNQHSESKRRNISIISLA